MAAYAIPGNGSMVTSKKISTKRKMSAREKEIREFNRTHDIDLVKEESGVYTVKITEKK